MAIAVHPYIHGVPHRIKYFEAVYDYMRAKKGVWFATGEEIYEWWKAGTPRRALTSLIAYGTFAAIRGRCRTGRCSGPLVHPSIAMSD